MIKSTFQFCVLTCVVLAASQAWAILILPGQTALSVPEPDPLGGVVVAGPMVTPLVGAAFNATVTLTVIQNDTTNPFGGLTFVYQVANSANSIDDIGRFTATGFSSWQTDMSFQPGAALPPANMNRSLNGNVVGFSFIGAPLGPAVLRPGAVSELLVVQTNAPAWVIATGNVIDGSIASGPVFAPVPEPGTTVLLLIGSLGLLVRRR